MDLGDAGTLGLAYGRLYGPIAVVAVLVASQPLFYPYVSGSTTTAVIVELGPTEPALADSVWDLVAGVLSAGRSGRRTGSAWPAWS